MLLGIDRKYFSVIYLFSKSSEMFQKAENAYILKYDECFLAMNGR